MSGLRWVLINRFAELTGYTVQAVETKVARGVFVQGVHYKKAPDGHICMNLEAYERWVEGDQAQALSPLPRPSASVSSGRAAGGERRSA